MDAYSWTIFEQSNGSRMIRSCRNSPLAACRGAHGDHDCSAFVSRPLVADELDAKAHAGHRLQRTQSCSESQSGPPPSAFLQRSNSDPVETTQGRERKVRWLDEEPCATERVSDAAAGSGAPKRHVRFGPTVLQFRRFERVCAPIAPDNEDQGEQRSGAENVGLSMPTRLPGSSASRLLRDGRDEDFIHNTPSSLEHPYLPLSPPMDGEGNRPPWWSGLREQEEDESYVVDDYEEGEYVPLQTYWRQQPSAEGEQDEEVVQLPPRASEQFPLLSCFPPCLGAGQRNVSTESLPTQGVPLSRFPVEAYTGIMQEEMASRQPFTDPRTPERHMQTTVNGIDERVRDRQDSDASYVVLNEAANGQEEKNKRKPWSKPVNMVKAVGRFASSGTLRKKSKLSKEASSSQDALLKTE